MEREIFRFCARIKQQGNNISNNLNGRRDFILSET